MIFRVGWLVVRDTMIYIKGITNSFFPGSGFSFGRFTLIAGILVDSLFSIYSLRCYSRVRAGSLSLFAFPSFLLTKGGNRYITSTSCITSFPLNLSDFSS